ARNRNVRCPVGHEMTRKRVAIRVSSGIHFVRSEKPGKAAPVDDTVAEIQSLDAAHQRLIDAIDPPLELSGRGAGAGSAAICADDLQVIGDGLEISAEIEYARRRTLADVTRRGVIVVRGQLATAVVDREHLRAGTVGQHRETVASGKASGGSFPGQRIQRDRIDRAVASRIDGAARGADSPPGTRL